MISRGRAAASIASALAMARRRSAHLDKPTFHILHNEQLVTAATRFDKGEDVHFRSSAGFTSPAFLRGAERALALPEKRMAENRAQAAACVRVVEEEARFHALKKKRDTIAAELRIDPSLIAPKSLLEKPRQ
jgi:uncharacterized protein (DUF1501 family)